MPVSVAAILAEFRQIEQRSPEDVAVLMTPLLGALEAIHDGREPPLDHAQVLAIANSLAQTAAQAGDADAAVAIAAASAELEQIPPETFAPRERKHVAVASATTPAAAAARPRPRPFANPYHQLLGIIGVCGLSYAGYLEIQARFQPGSVAGWLLTASSSLLALALALAWRRFVLRNRRGPVLALLALLFAVGTTGWAVQLALSLAPQNEIGPQGTARAPASTPQKTGTGADTASAPPAQLPVPEGGPIAFWWLGQTPEPRPTRIPMRPRDAGTANASTDLGAAHPETATTGTRGAPAPQSPHSPPPQGTLEPAAAAPRPPETQLERYQGLLERDVVLIDHLGMRHEGKLTGISNHGVTLLMEVELFGQPILAQRLYLFDDIEKLDTK